MTQPLSTLIFTVTFGILSLVLAKKTKVPSILFLLFFGVLLGPHAVGWVNPTIFRHNFPHYISLMVTLILFEGAASLHLKQLRDISTTLRNLLMVGSMVTLAGVALGTRFITGMSWTKSILFGAILVVTGPTVVIPILQRLRVRENLHNVLKWEAILIDPLGVVAAVVLFEFFMVDHTGALEGLTLFVARFLIGLAAGLAAGFLMYLGLTQRRLLKLEGRELGGLYILGLNLLFFGFAEWALPESGLVAAVTAGIFLGNKKFPFKEEIFYFKEQITGFALSVLFILIAGNVPIRAIKDVLLEGAILLAVIIFLIRPCSVFLSTAFGPKIPIQEKLFLSFMAPRGIVSAVLASLFAISFEEKAVMGRGIFLPLAFFVICGTVVFYALFSGILARLLGVQEKEPKGLVIVGANGLGLFLAEELRKRNVHAVLVDTNPAAHSKALVRNFPAFLGSGFDREFVESMDLKGIGKMIAVTSNHEANVLCCQSFSSFLGRQKVFRLWDETDSWEQINSAHYDAAGGRPVYALGKHPGLDLMEVFELGNYRVTSEALEAPLKVGPEVFNRVPARFPIFACYNNSAIFLTSDTVLPAKSELVYVEPNGKQQ